MAKQRLYIVGAGGFGREVSDWARDTHASFGEWDLAGFLDDNPNALSGLPSGLRVVGAIDGFRFESSDRVVVAISEPRIKYQVVSKLQNRVQFATIVHRSVILGSHCRIGDGCVLCPNVVLTNNIDVGEHVHLNLKVTVGHDARIGAYSTLNSHVDITGCVTVEESVFMGSHAVVLPRGRVGAFARVGAGSVVLRSVQPNETVLGVPAKKV